MKLIIVILFFGIIFRSLIVANGNFLFNMDNARDAVDVREMIVLKNPRLIGPGTALEGVYNGPAWYYLLALPFFISGGDPYAAIVLQIIFWAVGGFFLLKMVSAWSNWLVLPIGFIWIASDYLGLTTQYAFNPNPVTLLMPLFIYLLVLYLKSGKLIYIASTFFIGGLFFNFEMNFGIFTPLIILMSIILTGKTNFLKSRNFWIGSLFFVICLFPQLVFDIRNNFVIIKALTDHIMDSKDGALSISRHLETTYNKFFEVFSATMMNHRNFSFILILLSIPALIKYIKQKKKDYVAAVAFISILLPFIIYTFFSSISVNPWHLGAESVSAVILTAFLLISIWKINFFGKIISLVLYFSILVFAFSNVFKFFTVDIKKENLDPSLFKNEIAAIDFVYQYAKGENFKVYTYMPSVYDYPYQYLIWWHGQKKYGYIPYEYAYLPDRPEYIKQKEKFEGKKDNFSGLVFLIKEPDRNYTRSGWEGELLKFKPLEKHMVGRIEIEVREEIILK